MHTAGIDYTNRRLADHRVSEVKAGKTCILLNLPSRKHARDARPFYTFTGKDAIDALKRYFDEDRGGWPMMIAYPVLLSEIAFGGRENQPMQDKKEGRLTRLCELPAFLHTLN